MAWWRFWRTKREQAAPARPVNKITHRNFKAGQTSNLTHGWTSSPTTLDHGISKHLSRIRARSRDLSLNNDYARRFLGMCKSHVVGHKGIRLQVRSFDSRGQLDERNNQLVEDKFAEWARPGNTDVTRRLSWWDCQRLFIHTVATDGEAFVQLVSDRTNPFGFALRFIDPEMVDVLFNKTLKTGEIYQGIEYDDMERVRAYWVKQKTRRQDTYTANDQHYVRIPASQMLHCYMREQVYQGRGFPWMASAMLRLNMLGDYEEAELIASQIAASKMGFFTRSQDGAGYEGSEEDTDDNFITEAEPGIFENLPGGVSFTPYDPQHPTSAFREFIGASLRGAAAGLGVSYNTLANDLSDVNFSSMRHGALEEREIWMSLQNWMIECFCTPIYERWLERAALFGQLDPIPFDKVEDLRRHAWQPRRWQWIDPVKEVQAQKEAVALGIKTRSQIIRDLGDDPDDLWREAQEEKQKMESYGLEASSNEQGNEAPGFAAVDPPEPGGD